MDIKAFDKLSHGPVELFKIDHDDGEGQVGRNESEDPERIELALAGCAGLGCGQCVTFCPSNSLALERRKKDETHMPPKNDKEWTALRAASRGISMEDVQ